MTEQCKKAVESTWTFVRLGAGPNSGCKLLLDSLWLSLLLLVVTWLARVRMRRNQGSISESASLAMFQQEHYLENEGFCQITDLQERVTKNE